MGEPWADELGAIRRAFERFPKILAGGDVELYLEDLHPEVEWVPIMALLEGRIYRGHDGVREWIEDLRHDWEVFVPVLEEIRPLGGGHFLLFGHWQARGRGSGVDLAGTQPATWLVHMRDGRVDRLQTFTKREEALKAAESLLPEPPV